MLGKFSVYTNEISRILFLWESLFPIVLRVCALTEHKKIFDRDRSHKTSTMVMAVAFLCSWTQRNKLYSELAMIN